MPKVTFFQELKRRNVFRVGIAYTVATWLLIQVSDTVFPRIGLPDSAVTLVIALLAIGFIPALIFAWAFEMTPDGLKRDKDVDRTQSIMPETGEVVEYTIETLNPSSLQKSGWRRETLEVGDRVIWGGNHDRVEPTQIGSLVGAAAIKLVDRSGLCSQQAAVWRQRQRYTTR